MFIIYRRLCLTVLLSCAVLMVLTSCSTIKDKWAHLFPDHSTKEVAPAVPTPMNLGPELDHGSLSPELKNLISPQTTASLILAADLNNDQWTDLVFLPDYFSLPSFYLYRPSLNKWEQMNPRPLNPDMRASIIQVVDLNRDGQVDLLLGGLNQMSELTPTPLTLYKGKKGKVGPTFTSTSLLPIAIGPQSTAVFLDYDRDGELDLFVGQWFSKNGLGTQVPRADQLLKGKGFQFTNVSELLKDELGAPADLTALPTISAIACDVNRDGYPDIITGSSDGMPNRLWMNVPTKTGDREFVDRGKVSSIAQDPRQDYGLPTGGRTFGLDCADYNGDGLVDVFLGEITHSYDSDSMDRSSLLMQVKTKALVPKFQRFPYVEDQGIQSWTEADRAGIFVDINLDGKLDFVVDNTGYPPKTRLLIFEQQSRGDFKELGKEYGANILNPSGTVVMDYNHDGKLDLLVGQSSLRTGADKKEIWPLINHFPGTGPRLKMFLRGKKSHPAAWGAQVVVKTNIRTLYQENKSPYGGPPVQHEEGLWFHLLSDEKILSMKIRWPAGPLVWNELKLPDLLPKDTTTITVCEKNIVKIGRQGNCN